MAGEPGPGSKLSKHWSQVQPSVLERGNASDSVPPDKLGHGAVGPVLTLVLVAHAALQPQSYSRVLPRHATRPRLQGG
jgi:hypothetical protein